MTVEERVNALIDQWLAAPVYPGFGALLDQATALRETDGDAWKYILVNGLMPLTTARGAA